MSADTGSAAPRLRPGLEAQIERQIPREWTIAHFDPKLPAVLSTPAMIGLMESAAAQAVQPALAPGAITVGTRIEVDHLKAAPAGVRVRARARLAEVNGRWLVFEVEARSRDEVIGRGRIWRAIVDQQRFTDKADRLL